MNPSDFPGGIKELSHADEQLASGAWGFEKVNNVAYKDWKAKYDIAKENSEPKPDPPYVCVPGSEFKQASNPDGDGATSSKASGKRSNKSAKNDESGTKKQRVANKAKSSSKGKTKLSEIIEDSDSEELAARSQSSESEA
ncbi:hypothetical protein RhiLY_14394 [Ceratobasidium sp. AG-Ba]|nr:hypothetical protein RhiLY_14394 [Ceratobasidium sp. AG-Ba]